MSSPTSPPAPRCTAAQDMFWGDRHGQLIDPFGHRWGISQHLRDVPPEEVIRAAAAMFGGEAG